MVIPANDNHVGTTGLRITAAAPSSTSEPLATLATIVRTLGVVGDRSDRVVLDAWARHVETGATPPGTRRRGVSLRADEDDARDWSGLCGAVSRSLENRAATCARTIEDLQTKLAVAQQDRREQEDRDVMDDLLIREHTRQLARAADRDDAVALRALVHSATATLMVLLDERCAGRNQRAVGALDDVDDIDDLDDLSDDDDRGAHETHARSERSPTATPTDGALADEFSDDDDDEPTVPALRSPIGAADRITVTRWRQ